MFSRPLVSSHQMSAIPLPPTGATKNVADITRCPPGGKIMLLENHWFREIQLLLQHHKALPQRVSKHKWVSLMKNNREGERWVFTPWQRQLAFSLFQCLPSNTDFWWKQKGMLFILKTHPRSQWDKVRGLELGSFLARVKLGDEDTLIPPSAEIEFLDDLRVSYNKNIHTQPSLQPCDLDLANGCKVQEIQASSGTRAPKNSICSLFNHSFIKEELDSLVYSEPSETAS